MWGPHQLCDDRGPEGCELLRRVGCGLWGAGCGVLGASPAL